MIDPKICQGNETQHASSNDSKAHLELMTSGAAPLKLHTFIVADRCQSAYSFCRCTQASESKHFTCGLASNRCCLTASSWGMRPSCPGLQADGDGLSDMPQQRQESTSELCCTLLRGLRLQVMTCLQLHAPYSSRIGQPAAMQHTSTSHKPDQSRRTLLLGAPVDLDEHVVTALAALPHRGSAIRDGVTADGCLQAPASSETGKMKADGQTNSAGR